MVSYKKYIKDFADKITYMDLEDLEVLQEILNKEIDLEYKYREYNKK